MKDRSAKRILLTGAGGTLGLRLLPLLKQSFKKANIFSVFHGGDTSKSELFASSAVGDLVNEKFLNEVIATADPDLIINLAALTDVDLCERQPELAQSINTDLVANFLGLAPSARLIQLSTDYVFSGNKGNYEPGADTSLLSVYGKTKLAAEELTLQNSTNLVVRSSGTYDWLSERNLFSFFYQRLSQKKRVRALANCHYSPIWAEDLARGVIELICNESAGVVHYAGPERLDRLHFAQTLAEVFEFDSSLIDSAKQTDFKWPAVRPTDSSLDSSAGYTLAGLTARPIRLAFGEMHQQMNAEAKM